MSFSRESSGFVFANNPGATPEEVYDALQKNATEVPIQVLYQITLFGHGKLNIYNAIYDGHVELEVVVFLEGAYTASDTAYEHSINS